MIGLIGVIDENDYIRYSQKFLKERKQVEEPRYYKSYQNPLF